MFKLKGPLLGGRLVGSVKIVLKLVRKAVNLGYWVEG